MATLADKLKSNPYEADLIPPLEAYVKEQVESGTYDFAANKSLLKLYGFYPEKRNDHVTALVLTKALMNLPSTDMVLCLHLIPDEVRAKEPIRDLVRYSEYLDTAKFVEFWEIANLGGNELLDSVPGFDEAIRKYIVTVLSITYQKLEAETFMDLLAVSSEHLEAYVSQWPEAMVLEGKFVVFVANTQNQPRPRKFKENISFEGMLPVIDLLTSP